MCVCVVGGVKSTTCVWVVGRGGPEEKGVAGGDGCTASKRGIGRRTAISTATIFPSLLACLHVSAGQGAVVGVTDFVLQRLRSFQGIASTDVTVVEVSRQALEVMVKEVPEVATAMQVGCGLGVSSGERMQMLMLCWLCVSVRAGGAAA